MVPRLFRRNLFDRLRIGIKCGGVSTIQLFFDKHGQPLPPAPPVLPMQVFSGTFLDPNGHFTPAAGLAAIYYRVDPITTSVTEWVWDKTNIVWIQSIA